MLSFKTSGKQKKRHHFVQLTDFHYTLIKQQSVSFEKLSADNCTAEPFSCLFSLSLLDLQKNLHGRLLSIRVFSVDGHYINNSPDLTRKYARIFVRGHYLFREANRFPKATLEESCELLGTDYVQGQISEHIFASNGGYCLITFQIFFATRAVLKIGEY